MSRNMGTRSPIIFTEKTRPRPGKLFSKDDRHVLAHLESLQGRTSPEMRTSPIKRPVDSPNHQMKSSFDFNGNDMPSPTRGMKTVYMKDYCSGYANVNNAKQ